MRWTATACLLMALASRAGAEDAKPEGKPTNPETVAVIAFGAADPDCLEWTDGCVICTRGEGATNCSTPGIACQPVETSCKKPAR